MVESILSMAQSTFCLSDQWINRDIRQPLKYLLKEEKENYRSYSNLRILKPKADQFLAMKILAARPEPSKDFLDANFLCRTLDIETKSQLLEMVSKYLPLSLLGERQTSFIKYLGEDLGYDWS